MKKDVFSPFVKVSGDYKNIQMLAYYRNNLVHLFTNESYLATALQAFGEQMIQTEGVSLKRLWEQTEFLIRILKDEFVVRDQIANYEDFMRTLQFMAKRGFLQVITQGGQESIRITSEGKFAITFFSSLMLPFVESYWVTLSYIKLMPSGEMNTIEILEHKVQTLAETMYNEGILIYYESCSRESIGNAIHCFVQLGALRQKIGAKGQPLPKNSYTSSVQKEVAYFRSKEQQEEEEVSELFERMTFFKPIVTYHAGIINYEDDVKRILQTKIKVVAAGANKEQAKL